MVRVIHIHTLGSHIHAVRGIAQERQRDVSSDGWDGREGGSWGADSEGGQFREETVHWYVHLPE